MPKIKTITRCKKKPILFGFQNGSVTSMNDEKLEVALFTDKTKNKKVLGASNGSVIYASEVNDDDLYHNFVAISRKGGKEIELVEIDMTTLNPYLAENAAGITPTKQHAVSELKKKFGSKKAKRDTEHHERLTLNLENITTNLEKIIETMDVDPETNIIPEAPVDSLYRPKINREASTKEGVYLLSDLVPAEVLNSLEDKVDMVLGTENINEFGLTSIIENQIQVIQTQSLPEKVLRDKCKLLICLNNIIEFMRTPIKAMTKKYTACDYSVSIDKYIKQTFMANGTRPLNMRDKCLCYIIVLLMIAMDYEADLEPLGKDVRVGLKKLKELARHLGFSQSNKVKSGIVLKIPVPPALSAFTKNKRKTI